MKTLKVEMEYKDYRLDQYLMKILNISRSQVQKWIDSGLVTVDGKEKKNSYRFRKNSSKLIKFKHFY